MENANPNLDGEHHLVVPWNTSNYMRSNAFHPIYESYLLNTKSLTFHKPEPHLFTNKTDADHKQITQKFWNKSYVNFFSLGQISAISNKHRFIEFHHTVPLVDGTKPFIFHCESFLPIFMPTAFQGSANPKDLANVKQIYQKLFCSNECLAIFSHVPLTLSEIDLFFDDERISQKLIYIPLAPSSLFGNLAQTTCSRDPNDKITYLFSSSFSKANADKQFLLRGGIASVDFAAKRLAECANSQFTFLCQKPSEELLASYGIDCTSLVTYERLGKMIWIQNRLTTTEISEQFQKSDFFLLPSANLHSASLTQALASGTIPICLKVPQTISLLPQSPPVIWLRDIQETFINKTKDGFFIDDHVKYQDTECQTEIANQLSKLTKEAIPDLKTFQIAAREYFHQHFDPKQNTKRFVVEVKKILRNYTVEAKPNANDKQFSKLFSTVTQQDFQQDVRPQKLAEIDGKALFQSRLGFYVYSGNLSPRDPLCWNIEPNQAIDGYRYFSNYSDAVDYYFSEVIDGPEIVPSLGAIKRIVRRNELLTRMARTVLSQYRKLVTKITTF